MFLPKRKCIMFRRKHYIQVDSSLISNTINQNKCFKKWNMEDISRSVFLNKSPPCPSVSTNLCRAVSRLEKNLVVEGLPRRWIVGRNKELSNAGGKMLWDSIQVCLVSSLHILNLKYNNKIIIIIIEIIKCTLTSTKKKPKNTTISKLPQKSNNFEAYLNETI